MSALRKTDLNTQVAIPQGLDVRYQVTSSARIKNGNHVLATLKYGVSSQTTPSFNIPLIALDPEQLSSVWLTDQTPELLYPAEGLTLSLTNDLIFGSIHRPAEDIEQATRSAYECILETMKPHQEFQLIRLWHFLPDINGLNGGMERYRLFSRARHDVLAASGYRMASDLPAASAVGSSHGSLVIHFLAGKGQLTAFENPRQVSAYHYPDTHGPRSPSFSRAMQHCTDLGRQLFLSGTASIIGHETVAPGNPEEQTQITLDNLAALLTTAQYPDISSLGREAHWVVYVRNPQHLVRIQPLIAARMHPEARIVYLQGDICRSDLMVEIEGTIFRSSVSY